MDDYDTFYAAQDDQISSTQLDPLAPTDPTLREEQEKDKTKIKKRTAAISLDPKLLLGDKGLSRLRRQGKVMKFHGKGREDEDLKRIMEFYQMWAHSLYPRLNMKDFSDRVVKVCSKRQCKETLNVWRQELVENKSVESMEGGFTGITIDDDVNASRSAGADDVWGNAANPATDPFFQSLSSSPPSISTASTNTTEQQGSSLTEEQKRKIDENRLKALAKRRAQASNPVSVSTNQPQEMQWDELDALQAQAEEEEYEDPAEEYV